MRLSLAMAALLLLAVHGAGEFSGYVPLNYTKMSDAFSGDPNLKITIYDFNNFGPILETYSGQEMIMTCFESPVDDSGTRPRWTSAGIQVAFWVDSSETAREIIGLRKVTWSEFDQKIHNFYAFADGETSSDAASDTDALAINLSGGSSLYTPAENKWEFTIGSSHGLAASFWDSYNDDIRSCFVSNPGDYIPPLDPAIDGWADCSGWTNKFCPDDFNDTIAIELPTPQFYDDDPLTEHNWAALACWDLASLPADTYPAMGTLGIEVILSSDGTDDGSGVEAHEINFIYSTDGSGGYAYTDGPYERLHDFTTESDSYDGTSWSFTITGIDCQRTIHFYNDLQCVQKPFAPLNWIEKDTSVWDTWTPAPIFLIDSANDNSF
jgi:hypothetical protein